MDDEGLPAKALKYKCLGQKIVERPRKRWEQAHLPNTSSEKKKEKKKGKKKR